MKRKTPHQLDELGALVRAARTSAGMTQQRLADIVGVFQYSLSNIELGRSTPTPRLAAAMARALHQDRRKWRALAVKARRESRARVIERLRATNIAKADITRSRLTAERVALGLTVARLAELAEIPPSVLCALETGAESPLNKDTGEWRAGAARVADAIGRTCRYLWPTLAPPRPDAPTPDAPERPDDLYESAEVAARLRAAVLLLPSREALVTTMRFGLDGEEPSTLEEIGSVFGLSRERVRQIEQRAMRSLGETMKDCNP